MTRSTAARCLYLCVGLYAGACQDSSATHPPVAVAQPKFDASQPATPAQSLVQAYIRLQVKLAQDDAAGAKAGFSALQGAAKAADAALGPELVKRIDSAAASGAAAAKLPAARVAFAGVSDAFLQWLKGAPNPLSQTLTVAHCPMALDGKGSSWLQLGDKLQNPYFGAEMLTCGTVEGSVSPGKKL